MDAPSENKELNTPFKLTGLDLMFGMPRSEWVTLYEKGADIERGIASMERVLDDFPLLRGRLVKRGDHLYVDDLDAGVQIEILDSEHPAPEMGPDIYPLLANGLLPEMPPVPVEDQESRPLAAFRYIRYSDGRLTVGSSISHALVDASAVTLFFLACRKAFFDEPYPKPVTDRSIILKLAGEGSDKPSAKSGLMLKPFDPQLFAVPPKPSDFFGMILSAAEYGYLAQRVKQQYAGALSFNNYLQAILLKVFAQSCTNDDAATTHANMSYDLRRMGPGFVPLNYFGGATIFRSFAATFDELRSGELQTIAQRFRELGQLDADEIKQDVGFVQAQYDAGNLNAFGAFSEFITPLINKGLYINNLIAFGRPEVNPATSMLWSEIPLRMPFVISMATLLVNHDNGISFRMALPVGQRDLFLEKWNECMAQELSEFSAT